MGPPFFVGGCARDVVPVVVVFLFPFASFLVFLAHTPYDRLPCCFLLSFLFLLLHLARASRRWPTSGASSSPVTKLACTTSTLPTPRSRFSFKASLRVLTLLSRKPWMASLP